MSPISITLNFFLFLFLFLFLHHNISAHSLTHPTGFTADFIHREYSPLSPFYNPSLTRFDRFHNTIRRSFSLASKLSSSPNMFQSQLTSIPGEYIMNISIGTPAFSILALADTGSDLTWTQCPPCIQCFNQSSPLFNPQYSSTYKIVPCSNSALCPGTTSPCRSNTDNCMYSYSYDDGSYSRGKLAVDTFTFGISTGRPVSFSNVAFGCGHTNYGYAFDGIGSGIVGLGAGPMSLINQLDSIHGKFSYCLFPINSQQSRTSKISFGSNGVFSGPGVVSTPLTIKSPTPTTFFYYLNLERITVGDRTFEYKGGSRVGAAEGNIIIDSGTTLTYLPAEMYFHLESLVNGSVNVEPVRDREGFFRVCYGLVVHIVKIPTITFHFTGGADVELPPSVTFHEVDDGMVCLTIVPTNDLAFFGNLHQVNLVVGYDVVNRKVSFKRTDCSKEFQ